MKNFPRRYRTEISSSDEIQSSSPLYDDEELEAIQRPIKRGYTAEGPESRALEDELADYFCTKDCIVTSSGTASLHLLLEALNIEPDSEIIFPSYTCLAVLNSIRQAGLTPSPADVDDGSLSLSERTIRQKLNKNTGTIILVHAFGYPVNAPALYEMDIPVIEDIAGAFGSKIDSKPVGSRGIAGIGSFYATKQISAGYGGFIISDNESLIAEIRDLKQYDGRDEDKLVYNYSLSDLEAAIARTQLSKIEESNAERRRIGKQYQQHFNSIDAIDCPEIPSGHSLYRYIIKSETAEEFEEYMNNNGIEVKRPVYKPLHRYLEADPAEYPVSENLHETARLIPNHPSLDNDDVNEIIKVTRQFFDG